MVTASDPIEATVGRLFQKGYKKTESPRRSASPKKELPDAWAHFNEAAFQANAAALNAKMMPCQRFPAMTAFYEPTLPYKPLQPMHPAQALVNSAAV